MILYTLGILANRLDSLFEKSDNDNRRLLYETVFKQVRVREGKIVYMEMNSPFTIIFSQAKGSESLLSGQPDKFTAHSSSGLGRVPLKDEITGSNPVCATNTF